MKKIIFLFLCLYSLAFGIVDFNEVNWGDSKSSLDLIFPKLKEEPSLYPDMKIYAFEKPNDNVSKYTFYFSNGRLFKIEVLFNKETVGRNEIKQIYGDLVQKMGKPISKNPIDQKFNGLTLRGNSLKFVPNISTSVYYKGIDTIDEVGKMIDSNLIIEYVDATKE